MSSLFTLDRWRSFKHFSSPWKLQASDRLNLMLCLTSTGLLAGILLTLPLWTGQKLFPSVPLGIGLPSFLSIALGIALIILVSSLTFLRNIRPGILSILVLLLILVQADINRLQPWVWMYSFILMGFAVYPDSPQGRSNDGSLLPALRLLLASIYLWSGIHKINPQFFDLVFPWLTEPLTQKIGMNGFWEGFAYVVPFIEIFIGVGLLFAKLRGPAIMLAIGSHLFVLSMIGPFGHNWNSSVWPWNLVMVGMVWALFAPVIQNVTKNIWSALRKPFMVSILAFWVLAPALNFFSAWDSYLSSSLYSGKLTQAKIQTDRSTAENFPDKLRSVTFQTGDRFSFFPNDWAILEMNSSVYPETWVYQAIRDSLSQRLDKELEIQLYYFP